MPCLCQRLLKRQFHSVTQDEFRVLKEVLAEVQQHLFPTQQPASRHKRPAPEPLPPRPSPQLLSSSSNNLVPASPSEQSQYSPPLPDPEALSLARTYSTKDLVGNDYCLDISQSGSKAALLFRAIERSNRNIQTQKFVRRICCYAFAQLHKKNTSISPIVQEIKKEFPNDQDTTTKVQNILRVGRKWVETVQCLGSIVERNPGELTGLLCLLEPASKWEKATSADHQSALTYLHQTTDILQRTLNFTHTANKALKPLLLEHSFVDETHRFLPLSDGRLVSMEKPQPNRSRLGLGGASTLRVMNTVASTEPTWKDSLVAVSSAILGIRGTFSEDARILLVLLAFFSASTKVPLDLVLRGASPRKRWDHRGEIQEVDSGRAGLASRLSVFLSDKARLSRAFHELVSSFAVSQESDETYTLTGELANRVHESLPAEDISFWRYQALVITYRAIPWKYLESTQWFWHFAIPASLRAYPKGISALFERAPPAIKVDLALTLVEASRFPTMQWKRFVLAQLEVAADSLQEQHVQYSIAASQCLVSRLDGQMDQGASIIEHISQVSSPGATDERLHSTLGQIMIQRVLNCIQAEDFSAVSLLLANWQPLGQKPSPMESIVLLRKHMLSGRILRFQGAFTESLTHLKDALAITELQKDVDFDDDLRDLTCDLADTLIELDDAEAAEYHLQAEITRRNQAYIPTPRKTLLDLSLAEARFAQQRFEEARTLCLDIESRPNLLKFEKLRLYFIMAKIYHIRPDHARAITYWSKAMEAVGKFQLTNGRTTRMIIMSICDNMGRLGHGPLLQDSGRQLDHLDKLVKPGGTEYWIAGVRHWNEYLQSRNLSRM
ncbi:hypothetical protein PG994_003360 [Apiospora phragmitis]|uniref:Uncharacterized protein n=1 Tax=Apiospora phragmitis TaxID=2905665 RepID=A0ABR1VXY3_9PEZI